MTGMPVPQWQKEEQQFQRLYRTPRGTVATILRKCRLCINIFQNEKGNGRPPNTMSKDNHL